jgi:hypothetical protein
MLQTILDLLVSDGALVALATAAAVLISVLVKVQRTKRIIHQVASLAFDVVNTIKDATPTKIDDKAALALRVIVDHLGRELSAGETELAKAVFDERHAQEGAAGALAAKLIKAGVK